MYKFPATKIIYTYTVYTVMFVEKARIQERIEYIPLQVSHGYSHTHSYLSGVPRSDNGRNRVTLFPYGFRGFHCQDRFVLIPSDSSLSTSSRTNRSMLSLQWRMYPVFSRISLALIAVEGGSLRAIDERRRPSVLRANITATRRNPGEERRLRSHRRTGPEGGGKIF